MRHHSRDRLGTGSFATAALSDVWRCVPRRSSHNVTAPVRGVSLCTFYTENTWGVYVAGRSLLNAFRRGASKSMLLLVIVLRPLGAIPALGLSHSWRQGSSGSLAVHLIILTMLLVVGVL